MMMVNLSVKGFDMFKTSPETSVLTVSGAISFLQSSS